MSNLTLTYSLLAWDDTSINSNPMRKPIDWDRTQSNIPVDVPSTNEYWIAPQSSQTLFNGTRSTSIDGTTTFSLSLLNLNPTTYRITYTAGTAPVFRTDRGLTLSGNTLTLVVLPNLSMTVTASTGTPFTAVQVGDTVFIPGLSTGDSAGPFNELNTGYWTVIAQTNTVLTLARTPGTVFSGISEVDVITSNTQFIAFSSAGVQVGDMVDISAGFSIANQGTFQILAVTPTWIEILSTLPLGPQTGVVPTASGIQLFSSAKSFILLEYDQRCIVQFNGDTNSYNRLSPFIAGDPNNVGHMCKTGPTWQCVVVNKSTVTLHITELSVE